MNLIEPNIHPVLVHFAYALMTTAALSMFVVSLAPASSWRERLNHAADWMLAFGALAVAATAAAGFEAYYTVAHDGPSHEVMTTHRNWAVPTAAVLLVLSLWRYRQRTKAPSVIFSALFLAAAVLLSVTAWWGGRVVYGHGIGVASLPEANGEGHDHEHAPGEGHDDEADDENEGAQAGGHEHDGNDDAHDDHGASDAESVEAPAFDSASYPETPVAVVDAYAAALRSGDEAALRAMLAPDVIIAEGGGAERSVEEYAGHHMPADMAFTAAVDFTLQKRDVLENGDMTTVISESQVHGTFRDQNIHLRMMETMVLKKTDGRWRIAHIHWSSAPITGEHEH